MKLLVREQIKTLLAQEGIKLKELAKIIEEATGKFNSSLSISTTVESHLLMYLNASRTASRPDLIGRISLSVKRLLLICNQGLD